MITRPRRSIAGGELILRTNLPLKDAFLSGVNLRFTLNCSR